MKVGTDAFLLGSWIELKPEFENILDVGTGCGVISLMLAQRSVSGIDAIDIDKESVQEANFNFERSKWGDRLNVIHISLEKFTAAATKKYDLVVSNPPFFQNSLLPTNVRLQVAKHNVALTPDVFVNSVSKLLTNSGQLCIILPVAESLLFSDKASSVGLYLNKQLIIFPKMGKPANRKILVFSKEKPTVLSEESLTLKAADGNFSREYVLLTHDYHADGYMR